MSNKVNKNRLLTILLIVQNLIILTRGDCVQLLVESSSSAPGSLQSVQEIDDNIRQQAFTASHEWNKNNSTWPNFFAVDCIVNAQQQIVAGIIYKLNVSLVETECVKDLVQTSNDLTNCNPKSSGFHFNCLFTLFVHLPYTNLPPELTSFNCHMLPIYSNDIPTTTTTETTTTTTKSSVLVGGTKTVDVNGDVQNAAFVASLIWNRDENKQGDFFKVTSINDVKIQVLAGLKYALNVTMAQTGCSRSKVLDQPELTPSDLDACEPETQVQVCHFDLLELVGQTPILTSSQCKLLKNQYVPDDENSSNTPVSIDIDGTVRNAAYEMSLKWNRLNRNLADAPGFFKLTDIHAAQKLGGEYLLNLTLTETYCSRSDILRRKKLVESELESCDIKSNSVNCLIGLSEHETIRKNGATKFNMSSFSVKSCSNQSIPSVNDFGVINYVNHLPEGFYETALSDDVIEYAIKSVQLWNWIHTSTSKYFKLTAIDKAGLKQDTSKVGVVDYYFNVSVIQTTCEKSEVFESSYSSILNTCFSNMRRSKRLRCDLFLQIDSSRPEEAQSHILAQSCQPIPNECVPDPVPAQDDSKAVNDLLQIEVDDNVITMGFDAVKLWNQETLNVWPNFLRLECLHRAMINITFVIVDCHLTATLVETNCKKNELLQGDFTDLDPSDLDGCLDLPNRYRCEFQLKFDENEQNERNRIQLMATQCLRIENF